MFVRYYVEIPLPPELVLVTLARDATGWMPGLAGEAHRHGEAILASVGFDLGALHVGKRVRLDVGMPVRVNGRHLIPLAWRATGAGALFPALDADLEIAPLGPHATQLAIAGRYEPPLGTLGRVANRALLHRVAEGTIKRFLDGVRSTIEAIAAAERAG